MSLASGSVFVVIGIWRILASGSPVPGVISLFGLALIAYATLAMRARNRLLRYGEAVQATVTELRPHIKHPHLASAYYRYERNGVSFEESATVARFGEVEAEIFKPGGCIWVLVDPRSPQASTPWIPESLQCPASRGVGSDKVGSDKARTLGPWRDGPCAVFYKGQLQSDRCLFTDEPVDANRLEVDVRALEPGAQSASAFSIWHQTAKLQKLRLLLPTSFSWSTERKQAKRGLAVRITLIGLVPTLIAGVLLYLACREVPPSNPLSIASLVLGTPGILLLLCGLSWPFLNDVPGGGGYVVARLVHQDYLWFDGVSQTYLARLPAWPGPTLSTIATRM